MKAIAAFVCLCMFASSAAFGNLPVIDGSNLTQNTVSAINNLTTAAKTTAAYAQQIQQYKTQLDQYADQVKKFAGSSDIGLAERSRSDQQRFEHR